MNSTSAFFALLLSVAASAQPAPMHGVPPYWPAPSPPETARGDDLSDLNGLDQEFLQFAVQSGLTELELGKQAQENSRSQSVRELGQLLIDDSQQGDRALVAIATRVGVTLPEQPDALQQQQLTHLQSLSGLEFDDAFLHQVITRQLGSLALFRREAAFGRLRSLRDFARDAVPVLKEHLKAALRVQRRQPVS